jgi:hypothetical protein
MTDSAILFQNNLDYKLPPMTSLTTNRVLKKQRFQNREYAGENSTMTCQWNTGTDFVDPKNSSLVLKIKTAGGSAYTAGFGSGSCANIIKNIRINHRSGTPYTNTQKINQWRVKRDRHTHSTNWFDTVGNLMGYDSGLVFDQFSGAEEHVFVIPLTHIHPFFSPMGGVPIPANVCAGLRVEIDTAGYQEAFIEGASGMTGYTITDCYFDCQSITLMDSAIASLNTVAMKQSLEYLYTDIFTSSNSHPSNTSQINVDVQKSVSLANSAFTLVQPTVNLSNLTVDSFLSPFLAGKWDYTLGSNHYPQTKIENIKLAYHTALVTYDKLKHVDKGSSVTLTSFASDDGIYSVSLERDSSLALSSSPINASRALRFEMALDTPPVTPHLVTVFLEYVTSSRNTLLSVKIDI